MVSPHPYSEKYFTAMHAGALQSALAVVPIVQGYLNPTSVIDVGCGTGAWLQAFLQNGIKDVWAIDGEWIDPASLPVPASRFTAWDLRDPIKLDERFDLVASLEVAEHLPPDRSGTFVQSLTGLGPAVLFSAAVPGQGGANHLNEQWPEYWAELFDQFGYTAFDCVREEIWENSSVDWWYAQNIVLYVEAASVSRYPALRRVGAAPESRPLTRIHPSLQKRKQDWSRNRADAHIALRRNIPPKSTVILPAADVLHFRLDEGRHIIPMLEKDGVSWGNPPDGQTAIKELERMREDGGDFLAFVWCTRWWLEVYPDFARHLHSTYACVADEEAVTIFDLARDRKSA